MNRTYTWYQELVRPDWAPPAWIFGPVWSFLYTIIAVSFISVFYKAYKKQIPRAVVIPFILNLIFNALFSPIQFGLQNNVLAMIDIFLVLATLVWFMKAIYPHMKWVALVNIPYLAWVSFATILQVAVTVLNF